MKHVSSCQVFLIFCADFYRASLAYQKNGKSLEELDKYVKKPNSLILGSQDVGLAMGYATICAESLGLSVCPVGVVRVKSLEIIKELKLPKYVIPIGGLCLGYPDDDPGLKPRLPIDAVFFEEKYDTEKAKTGIDQFDETYHKYLKERGSDARDSNWSKSLIEYMKKEINLVLKIWKCSNNKDILMINNIKYYYMKY